jgi:hypothetical protein
MKRACKIKSVKYGEENLMQVVTHQSNILLFISSSENMDGLHSD